MAYSPETIALVLLLIAAFLVAFMVLKMLIETATVGLISGSFYVALVFITEQSFSIQTALTYSLMGVVLYMAYSILASMLKITSETFSGLSKLIESINGIATAMIGPIADILQDKKDDAKRKMSDLQDKKDEKDEEEESNVKEVVLEEEN